MAGSEIATLMERIRQEHEAATRALTGFAIGSARHEYITKRMETIGMYHEQLSLLIGQRAAIQAVAAIMDGPKI